MIRILFDHLLLKNPLERRIVAAKVNAMRFRMDRFVGDALIEFTEWYVNDPNWRGKERDCVNLFVTQFLSKNIVPGTAIGALSQIRIECAVMQPSLTDSSGHRKYPSLSAAKDIVIWRNSEDTTWDANWQAKNMPRAIIEWKTYRSGRVPQEFDKHDEEWLIDFTSQHPETIGFLVSTYSANGERHCKWACVKRGLVGKIHIS